MNQPIKRPIAAPSLKKATRESLYHQLKLEYAKSNKFPAQSFLRIDQVLKNTGGKYKFDIKANSSDSRPELRLERNDLFVASHIGFFLVKQVKAKKGKEVLQSYPNQTVFASAEGFDPTDLELIYNGELKLKVGTTVNVETMTMQNFRKVPQTQQSSSTNKSQWDLKAMCHKLETPLYLHGTASQEISVEFDVFDGLEVASVDNAIDHKLVMFAVGYLVKSGAAEITAK